MRAAHMNRDDFRNRSSLGEQRMMGNLAEILAPKE